MEIFICRIFPGSGSSGEGTATVETESPANAAHLLSFLEHAYGIDQCAELSGQFFTAGFYHDAEYLQGFRYDEILQHLVTALSGRFESRLPWQSVQPRHLGIFYDFKRRPVLISCIIR